MTYKVHEVAAIVVKAIGLKEGDAFEPAHDGDLLRDDHSIGSFKIDDKTKIQANGRVYCIVYAARVFRWK